MKRFAAGLAILFMIAAGGGAGRVLALDADIRGEIEQLKKRITELEQMLHAQEAAEKPVAAETHEAASEKLEKSLEERLGSLALHGGAVLYYQGSHADELDGKSADSPSGAGIVADLELSWKPALPLSAPGEFLLRLHAGDGTGADRDGNKANDPADVLLGNLNTIADDNSDENDDSDIRLLEAFYQQEFFGGTIALAAGKTEQWRFLDQNAFANDEYTQFVGKPFVNNSVMDSENEYTPIVALQLKPDDMVSIVALAASTSRPLLEGSPLEGKQKSKYDNVFSTPFLGAQLTVSPVFAERQGNYRLFGWYAGYDHAKLDRNRDFITGKQEKGWGLGISADQQLSESVGVFGRFGWNNEEVYVVAWEASGGVNVKGLVPGRGEDEIGLGLAGLVPDSRYVKDDPEVHLELYYRIAATENLAFTPDVQYVWNPGGDSDNDGIFAGMVRAEFNF
jgi:hypothetical protein